MIKKEIIKILLKDIVVPEDHRSAYDPEKFCSSIKIVGQINPITVQKVDKERKYELVTGFNRLMGHSMGGLNEIEAIVVDGDKQDIELIKIEENLTRNELTTLEKYEHIKRKAEILETRSGGKATSGRPIKGDTVSPFITTKSIADDIGYSERTVQRACQIAQNILPEAKENIRGTEVANSVRDLLDLAKLEPEKQIEVTKPITEGKCKTIKEARNVVTQEERQKKFRDMPFPETPEIKVINNDFRKVKLEPNSIDFIFTDPPYLEEYIPLLTDLSKMANRVLKPGKFAAIYMGHYHLQEAMERLSQHLDYYWICCQLNTQGNILVHSRNIFCLWKPILIFCKPPLKRQEYKFSDVIQFGKKEKELHVWQQSEHDANLFIEAFSSLGDTILDPFVGSGTTAVAAIKKKRKFIGIDIDPQCIKTTELRIKELYDELQNNEDKG